MNIAETVQEIIDGEEVDREDINQVANEIAAMVVLNQALNNALWIASDKLGKANTARDKAIAYVNDMLLQWQHDITLITSAITAENGHYSSMHGKLEAINRLMELSRNLAWGAQKMAGIARGEITDIRDMDEIPF